MQTQHPRTYGWLAAILAILLLLVLYMWITARAELSRATSQFTGDISTYSAQLINECKITPTTTPAQRAACEGAFAQFSDTFKAYGKTLVSLTATASPAIAPYVVTPSTTASSTVSSTPSPSSSQTVPASGGGNTGGY